MLVCSAGSTAGQEPPVEAALALLEPERGEEAMWLLLEGGAGAVPPLLEGLRRNLRANPPDWRLAHEQVRVLGLLGKDAARATAAFVALLRTGPRVLHEDCVWVLGEIAPYAPRAIQDAAIDALQSTTLTTESRIPILKIAAANEPGVNEGDPGWCWHPIAAGGRNPTG